MWRTMRGPTALDYDMDDAFKTPSIWFDETGQEGDLPRKKPAGQSGLCPRGSHATSSQERPASTGRPVLAARSSILPWPRLRPGVGSRRPGSRPRSVRHRARRCKSLFPRQRPACRRGHRRCGGRISHVPGENPRYSGRCPGRSERSWGRRRWRRSGSPRSCRHRLRTGRGQPR